MKKPGLGLLSINKGRPTDFLKGKDARLPHEESA